MKSMKMTFVDLEQHRKNGCPTKRLTSDPNGGLVCLSCNCALPLTTAWVRESSGPPVFFEGMEVPEVLAKRVRKLGYNDPEVQGMLAAWEELDFPEDIEVTRG